MLQIEIRLQSHPFAYSSSLPFASLFLLATLQIYQTRREEEKIICWWEKEKLCECDEEWICKREMRFLFFVSLNMVGAWHQTSSWSVSSVLFFLIPYFLNYIIIYIFKHKIHEKILLWCCLIYGFPHTRLLIMIWKQTLHHKKTMKVKQPTQKIIK